MNHILMTRAKDKYGQIVSIQKVNNGKDCECTCVVCGSDLVARQGKINTWSFAHASEAECGWSGETELHLIAKEVLEQDKFIQFSHVTLGGKKHNIKLEFKHVEQEVSLDHLRPDIIAVTPENDEVFIEVCVTHACEDEKIKYFQRKCLNVLEVVLPPSILPQDIDTIDVDFVRSELRKAEVRCISLNPLSSFCEVIVSANRTVISNQGEQLRSIRKQSYQLTDQIETLRHEMEELKVQCSSWERIRTDILDKARQYRTSLNQQIESQPHVIQYRQSVELCQQAAERQRLAAESHHGAAEKYQQSENQLNIKLEELEKQYLRERQQIEDNAEEYEQRLRKNIADKINKHIYNIEIQKLIRELEELKEEKGKLVIDNPALDVALHKKKLEADYEMKFTALSEQWDLLIRTKSHLKKPAFFDSDKSKRPASNTYAKARG